MNCGVSGHCARRGGRAETFSQTPGEPLFSAAASAASWSSGAAPDGAIHNHLTIDLNDFLSIFGRMTAAH
jgi:hypothetical protein